MDERRRVANGLTEDLQIARASVKLMFHLREMFRENSSLVFVARDFLWLAMRNSRDSAVVHLWKVLDSQKSARSLRWFISTQSVLSATEKQSDLSQLSASTVVARLKTLRHQVFAHRGDNTSASSDAAVLAENNITEIEFLTLIGNATSLLRKHYGTHLSKQVDIEEDDAIGQLIDLDIYLEGAYRGDYGIEPLALEVDGQLRAPMKMVTYEPFQSRRSR